jgi:glyoxylase-like metal-dependent hydrolase (beta-lactamase superfamily II)
LPHVAEPSRLWAGSLKTLGATAEAYGPIAAVPADRLLAADDLDDSRIEVIFTPGHAPHHISYRVDRLLFAGEAGGVCLAAAPGHDFMRPATPPRFRMDIALERLMALIDLPPSKICYSHFGLRENASGQLEQHRQQLLRWRAIVADEVPRHPAGRAQGPCLQRLLREDPGMHAFQQLSAPARRREIGFLKNSLQGFIEAFEEDHPAG